MKIRDQRRLLGPLIVAFSAAPSTGRAASFEWLESEPDYGYAIGMDLSGDGSSVVGNCSSGPNSGRPEACRWRAATGWRGLGYLPGHDISEAYGVSARGNIVVGKSFSTTTSETQAFRWTSTDGMTGLGFSNGALAVSANGGVVAGMLGSQPFRWTPTGGLQELGYLPGYAYMWLRGISANGAVLVGEAYNQGPRIEEAFRWTEAGGMQALGFLPSPFDYWSSAAAASADGSVVVGTSSRYGNYGDIYDQAFIWRQSCGCMEGLGFLPHGNISNANDISSDGTVIVGGAYGSPHGGPSGYHAVVWTPRRGLQTLADILVSQGVDVPESLYSASKVSADGRWILGYALRDVSGQTVRMTFRAYIGPDFTGTGGPDTLIGTHGDDVIDGMGGADLMIGLAGNDTYFVDAVDDVVVEYADDGTDNVNSSVTYTLPPHVEKLNLTGTLAINGSGNTLSNTLGGNAANNVLNGKAGADILRGRSGNDVLIGGPGADTLNGGPGRDRFLFNAALGGTNIDVITDFTPGDDLIRLENAVFTGLPTTGQLEASAFAAGTAATTAAHRILYDAATGQVRYDTDGTGPASAVYFGTLTTKPVLANSDVYVQ